MLYPPPCSSSAPPPGPFTLAPDRVHEAQGQGRRGFALFQAMRQPGVVIWILPAHLPEVPMPAGLPRGLAERLLLLRPASETDLLWSTEEALRARAAALVIAEPDRPLSLTAGRRLQLAAEAGRTAGLMLIRAGAGSNAVESRWECTPLAPGGPHAPAQPGPWRPAAHSTLHRWSLIKNKKGTLSDWTLDWDGTSVAFDLVCAAGQ